jgi:hypothetical protein
LLSHPGEVIIKILAQGVDGYDWLLPIIIHYPENAPKPGEIVRVIVSLVQVANPLYQVAEILLTLT